ncbi:hypothetical protein [Aquirufa sp. 5-AUSEE-100C1]
MNARLFSNWLLGSGIILLFTWQILRLSHNSPFLDDVNFIDFVNQIAQKNLSTTQFLRSLFMVDNNHMAVIPKIGLSIQYLLFQDINFQRILLISLAQLTAIAWLLWKQTQSHSLAPWKALPILLLWFQPQYYEVANWAMTGIQQSSVILFTLVALHFIAQPGPKNLALAIFFAAMAFYSFGSGVLAYVGIGYYLLANRRFKEIMWLAPSFVLQLASYLYMSKIGSVVQPASIEISHAIPFFLNLVGTLAMFIQWHPAEIAWGLGLLFVLLGLRGLWKIDYKSQSATLLLILLANCLLIVSNRDGSGLGMISRFACLSPLIAIALYLIYLPSLSKGKILGIIGLSAVFWAGSYMQYLPAMYQQKHDAIAERANWDNNRRWLYCSNQFQDNAAAYLRPSYEQGIWQSENSLIDRSHFNQCLTAPLLPVKLKIQDQTIEIQDYPLIIGLNQPHYLLFYRSDKSPKMYIKNIPFRPNSKKNILLGQTWVLPNSFLDLHTTSLESGDYQLFLYDAAKKQFWKTAYRFQRP